MLKAKDLRDVSPEELELKLETIKREIYDLRSQRMDAQNNKTHLIGQKRKEIARIKTIKREQELKRVG